MRWKPLNKLLAFSIVFPLIIFAGCNDSGNKEDQNAGKSDNTTESAYPDTSRSYPKSQSSATRGSTAIKPDTTRITIGYVDWTEGVAMTHVVEQILEDRFNKTVRKQQGYVGQILDSLAVGAHDIFLDHWLATDSSLNKMADFNDVGINYRDACMGLVVPEYMPINSIAELKNYDGTRKEILGIDEDADVMQKTKAAIKAYNLDYELIIGSGPAMARQLQQCVEDDIPVVVTGWRPHWKFSRFDLKFLDDPKNIFGRRKNIHTLTRKGLADNHPQVVAFLKNFQMNTKQLGKLLEVFAQSNDWDKAAKKWCDNHPELIEKWLPEEAKAS